MTTLAARLPDDLLRDLDALVAAGDFPNRTAVVRTALERLIADERRREVDRQIVEGYRRFPAEPPTSFERELAERSIAEEPW